MLIQSREGKWSARDPSKASFAIWLLTICPLKLSERDLRYYGDIFLCHERHVEEDSRSHEFDMLVKIQGAQANRWESKGPPAISDESLWCLLKMPNLRIKPQSSSHHLTARYVKVHERHSICFSSHRFLLSINVSSVIFCIRGI